MFDPPPGTKSAHILRIGLLLGAMLGVCPPVAWPADRPSSQAPAQPAPTQTPKPDESGPPSRFRKYFSGLFEAGGEMRTPRDHTGKFEELRDVPRGAYVRTLRLNIRSDNAAPEASFTGLELGQQDQRASADFRRVGRYRTTFLWDQIPHSFAEGRSLLTAVSPGLLEVDAGLRARFESATDQALPDLVRSAIADVRAIPLRMRRDTAFVRQTIQPTENWEMHVEVQRVRSRGTRPISAGTFIRRADPAFLNDGVWEGLGVEMAEPVEYRTTNVSAGTQVAGDRWVIGVDYTGSALRNDVDALTWTNPFRVTDGAGTPARTPAETVLLGAGFTANRNRFVRAQLDLVPNNDYNSFNMRGRYNLPGETQVRGLVSVARWTQNDPFLPYTLNTALAPFAATLPPGQSPLSVSSLPAQSLDGAIRTITQDYTLVNRRWRTVDFQLQYRSYDLDNQNPHLTFPGYASFGDSGWRTSADFYGMPIENLPQSFIRQNASVSAAWKPTSRLTWREDYQLETWNRTNRDVDRTNDHRVRSRVDWRAASGVGVSGDFTYANRTAPDYRSTPLEFSELRRFDEAARTRKDGRLAVDLRQGEKSTFSLSARQVRDDYAEGFYGLLFNDLSLVDAQYTISPWERASLYAGYSTELNRFAYRGLATVVVGGITTVFPRENTWERTSRSAFHSFQVGIDGATAGERFVFDLAYVWSFARDRITTTNPFGPVRVDSVLSATAFDYPDTTTKIQVFNVSASHELRERLRLGFRYWYEPFALEDFALDTLQPYAQGTITSGAPRELFLDARFKGYRANVASVFLHYSF